MGLRAVCLQKYYSCEDDADTIRDKSFDSLIVSEWKPASFKPTPITGSTPYRHTYYNYRYQPKPQTPASAIIDDMEWVDLGLPSGILWAKDDAGSKTSFMGARNAYGSHVPSRANADELYENCTRKWDDAAHALIFTGPNRNTLSFPCTESNKSYWLNAYEKDDMQFGQCFHIGPDGHFWINDKDSYSALYVRLVSR